MKPIELKMAAFGSYIKPVTLDFENNLSGKKIFLIHGATGAGKTTILDAICFALYGTASGDDRDGAMMRSKGVADSVRTEVKFIFALGEKKYTINRQLTCRLKRGGDKEILQSAELLLDGQIIETKSTSVTKRIKALLGFDAKQFRQVVLLPQGEFKKFLFAKADDRQPVLDALFNAEFYKRVEDGLKLKADTAQKIFDALNRDAENLKSQLQGRNADAESLEKLRADLEFAQKKSAELKKISDAAQDELTAGKILARDFDELERRNKALESAAENLKQAEKIFIDTKVEYDLREGEQSQREKIKSEVDALAKIKKALADLEVKRRELDAAEKILKAATDKLGEFEVKATGYAELLAKREARRDELSGAEKELAEAQVALDKAREREKVLQEISRLEGELNRARQKISAADKNSSAAKLELERLQKLRQAGSAALLAKNLKDGEPCPVCGSRIHYPVAFGAEIIPSDKEIDAAQIQADRCNKNLDNVRQNAATIEGQLLMQKEALKKFADVPAKEVAQKIFDKAQKNSDELNDCRRRIEKGNRLIKENNTALEAARKKLNDASNDRAQKFGEVQTIQNQIPQNYSDNRRQLDADIESKQRTLRELETAWKRADKTFRDAGNKKSSCEATFNSARKAQQELAEKLKDKTLPDIEKLKTRAEELQKNYAAAIRAENSLENDLKQLKNISLQLAELQKKISAAEKDFILWKKLSDVASGKIAGKKISFVRYYLRAMFDQVLTEANYRLLKMSDNRYWFRQKDAGKTDNATAGLNLEIFDENAGEARPVATLSGGESFLASLSLALGLAAVVRNNSGGIRLDTIFIDEGFGTLDSETLDFAMKTLIELQSGGRLVGIISHVEELKNQMPVRLEVIKTKTGSTAGFKH